MTRDPVDPVDAVLDRASTGLALDDQQEIRRFVREGLADIDPVVGRDDLAIELGVVARIPPDERVRWARRFADERRAFRLSRRSFELLEAFHRGTDVAGEARDLLAEVETVLERDLDEDIRYQLGDVALECRYILSGGTGPASLRTPKTY